MAIFHEHMAQVLDFYEVLENDAATYTEFIQLQKMQTTILNARNAGEYDNKQYKSIYNAWLDIMDRYRQAIARIDPTYAAANNIKVEGQK